MLKVVVFDGGWGGELVANYLQSSLATVEVIRVIDWSSELYDCGELATVYKRAEGCLTPYAGKVDLIVLGGYTTSQALAYLQERFPNQRFVGVGIDHKVILRTRIFPDCVVLLADELFRHTVEFESVCRNLPESSLVLPDCSGWERLIDIGEMTAEILQSELEEFFQLARQRAYPAERPDYSLIVPNAVILLNTHFWEIKEELQKVFGYGVSVIDFRQKLLHDVCRALDLLGGDGVARY